MTIEHSLYFRSVRKGLASARRNLLPGSLLIACGLLVVAGYYTLDGFHRALTEVGSLKTRLGFAFSIPSTAFFGGILPLVLRRVFLGKGASGGEWIFTILFWSEKGAEVDLLYRLQARFIGEGNDFATIFPKVLIDQLIYVPLFAVPTMTVAYLWKEEGFSLSRTREAFRNTGYWERALPLMLSNWVVWIPAVAIIYSFPLALQLPLQNLTLSAWVLLMIVLFKNDSIEFNTREE